MTVSRSPLAEAVAPVDPQGRLRVRVGGRDVAGRRRHCVSARPGSPVRAGPTRTFHVRPCARRTAAGWGWQGDSSTNYDLLTTAFPHPDSYRAYEDELDAREPLEENFPDYDAYQQAWKQWDAEYEVFQERKTSGAVFIRTTAVAFRPCSSSPVLTEARCGSMAARPVTRSFLSIWAVGPCRSWTGSVGIPWTCSSGERAPSRHLARAIAGQVVSIGGGRRADPRGAQRDRRRAVCLMG